MPISPRLGTGRFRALLCCNVLEHVRDPGEFARRCGTLVMSGGVLAVTVPRSYPHHSDPIDTLYRPTPEEAAALFPGDLGAGGRNHRCRAFLPRRGPAAAVAAAAPCGAGAGAVSRARQMAPLDAEAVLAVPQLPGQRRVAAPRQRGHSHLSTVFKCAHPYRHPRACPGDPGGSAAISPSHGARGDAIIVGRAFRLRGVAFAAVGQ